MVEYLPGIVDIRPVEHIVVFFGLLSHRESSLAVSDCFGGVVVR